MEIKKAIEWMKSHNHIDEEDENNADLEECLLENWDYCFEYRSNMIKEATGNMDEILSEWPALNNEYGFYLVRTALQNYTVFSSESFQNYEVSVNFFSFCGNRF